MKVIVIGCGRFGIELACRLDERGDEVVVLDSSPEAFNDLPTSFKGRLVEGDALNQDVLERAGIKEADALAAVTNSDPLNLVVGRIAREVYQVSTVAARNYEMTTRELYETFNLQVVTAASWGTMRMVEILNHTDARLVYSAGNGEVGFYEFIVPETCVGANLIRALADWGCNPVAVTRGGKAFIPDVNTVLETGDVVSVSTTLSGVEELRKQIAEAGRKC